MNGTGAWVRVVLVRHGQTDWNAAGVLQGHRGPGLNACGIAEATALAAVVPVHVPEVGLIVTSDLDRAHETARLLGRRLPNAPMHVDEGWREVDVGTWAGKSMADIARDHPGELRAWLAGEDVRRGGGETREETLRRTACALASAVERVRDGGSGALVVVSHGGPIRYLVAAVLGLWPDGYRQLEPPRTASLTVLAVRPAPGEVLRGRLEVYNNGTGSAPPPAS